MKPHASVENSRHVGYGVGKSHARFLQFHSLSTWNQSISSPSKSYCPALPSGIKHNAFSRGASPQPSPLPAARPGCPVPPVVEGWHSGDSLYYPIQWVESKDRAIWDLIMRLGYSGSSSPPGWAYLQPTPFIRRIYPVYTWGRHCSFENISRLSGVKISINNYQKKIIKIRITFLLCFLVYFLKNLPSYLIPFCSWFFSNFYFIIIQPWVYNQSFESPYFHFTPFEYLYRG